MTGTELAWAAAILVVGGTVQASIGFGAMVVAAPILILIDPALVPGPALVAATLLVVLIAWRDRAGLEARGVGWTIAGRVPGTVVGGLAVAALSPTGLELLFGALLLLAVVISAGDFHLERTPTVLTAAGALSGLMATATSVGGPPLALVYQREAGPTIRATLNGIFLVASPMSLGMLAAVGELGLRELGRGLAISPGIVVGFVISGALTDRLDRRSLRPAVLVVAGVSALAVLLRAAL